MPKRYAYNTSATQVKKRYAMIGSTATQVKKRYAMIGSTATLVYSAETVVSSKFGSGTAQNWKTREKSATSSTFTCAVGDVISFTCLQHLYADNAGFNAENNISIGGGYRIYKGSTVVKTDGRDVQFNGTQTYNDKTWNVSYTVTSAGTYKVEVYAFVGEKNDRTIYAGSYTNITTNIIVS